MACKLREYTVCSNVIDYQGWNDLSDFLTAEVSGDVCVSSVLREAVLVTNSHHICINLLVPSIQKSISKFQVPPSPTPINFDGDVFFQSCLFTYWNQQLMQIMLKVTHDSSPIYITEMFQIKGCNSEDTMTLRLDSNKNFKTPKPKLNMFKKAYLIQVL